MKRHGNLWDKIVSMENIKAAFIKAAHGKHSKPEVAIVENNLDYYLKKIKEMLDNGTFTTSKYRIERIFEPKERLIYILPFFPDRIIHHAIMNVIEPIWDNLFIFDSYACRKGKGPHKGSTKCVKMTMNNKYCLKCDISKYYPSINHNALKRIVEHKIKDRRVLDIIFDVIDSIPGETNVPIGNYMSQWLGNLYLNELDSFVKHTLHFKDYLRYCDDFCFFSNSKKELHNVANLILDFVTNHLLLRFSKMDLFKTTRGVDFLGYRHFYNGKILVRKSTAKNMMRYVKEIPHLINKGLMTPYTAECRLASVKGWISHANAYNLNKYMKLEEMMELVRSHIRRIEAQEILRPGLSA